MPKSKKKRPSSPRKGEQVGRIGSVRRVGFGLGLKFALGASLTIAVLVATMGAVLYRRAADSQDRQLDTQGTFVVRVAALPTLDQWRGAGTGSRPRDGARSHLESRLREAVQARGVLDLWVATLGDQAKIVATATGRTPPRVRAPLREVAGAEGTRRGTGAYTDSRGATWPARFFTHPVTDGAGKVEGEIWLALDETELRATRDALFGTTVGFVIGGIAVGALLSFLLARTVTTPLAALMQDVRTISQGRLTHRIRVRSDDEVGSLASALDQMTRQLLSARDLQEDLEEKEHEVALATQVQRRLFPEKLPEVPGLRLDAAHRVQADLSSDLFDALPLGEGRLGVLVMSASGRGVPAAIVLSMARSLFRGIAPRHTSAADTLREMNRILTPDLRRGFLVSASYAVIEPGAAQARIASAGPRVPVGHYLAEPGGLRAVHPDGMAIGLDGGAVFDNDLREAEVPLGPGDRLVLATEGVALCTDPDGEPLGTRPFLQEALRVARQEGSAESLIAGVLGRATQEVEQDLTVVLVERTRG